MAIDCLRGLRLSDEPRMATGTALGWRLCEPNRDRPITSTSLVPDGQALRTVRLPAEGCPVSDISRLYGLTIRSELQLHQARTMPPGTEVDFEIRLGEPAPPTEEPPPGHVMLHLQADRQYYTATKTADGYLLRFYNTCDVWIDPELSGATVHLYPGADPAIAAVLAGGTVLAFVLSVRGRAVLHASGVQVGDRALAFVGASGMGKSTMATLLCADGGKLITDDLLVLDLDTTQPTCSLGATELRLRKSVGELSTRFASAPGHRVTGDARDALAVVPSTDEALPLAGIVVPLPEHSGELIRPDVIQLDPMAAFLLLSRFPRLLGWKDEDILRRQFQQLGDIVERVPIHLARLPWGPPFADNLAAELRQAVGLI